MKKISCLAHSQLKINTICQIQLWTGLGEFRSIQVDHVYVHQKVTRRKSESENEVVQSCLTLCNPMDSSLHQAPPSMGFSRQEYWSGLPFPSPGNLLDPGIEPRSPTLQTDALPSEPSGKSREQGGGEGKERCCQ